MFPPAAAAAGGRAPSVMFAAAPMKMAAAGGGMAAPVAAMPVMPLQAAFQAAPVQTRHQKADLAKDSFRQGAAQVVNSFVTQILPKMSQASSSNPIQVGQMLLQQLDAFIKHYFQGVDAKCVQPLPETTCPQSHTAA
jgi:hypothetical protein